MDMLMHHIWACSRLSYPTRSLTAENLWQCCLHLLQIALSSFQHEGPVPQVCTRSTCQTYGCLRPCIWNHSIQQPPSNQPTSQSITPSINQLIIQLVNQTTNQSISPSVHKSINHSISQPEPTSQSIHKSISHSINQTITITRVVSFVAWQRGLPRKFADCVFVS